MTSAWIDIPKKKIAEFCRQRKIKEFSLFGSALRENFGPKSDVDILIEFAEEADWSLYDWVDMIDELKDLFDRDVDLVSKQGLRNPFRRHSILKSREVVFASDVFPSV